MVLRSEVGLNALAVLRSRLVDVLSGLVASHEGDPLHALVLTDELDGRDGAVDDANDALGSTCQGGRG